MLSGRSKDGNMWVNVEVKHEDLSYAFSYSWVESYKTIAEFKREWKINRKNNVAVFRFRG